MDDVEFAFQLKDRINLIRDTINKYGLSRFYIAFSGGKDSVVLSTLIDMALPDNTIKRIFANTGVEYTHMVKFVTGLAENDNRIIMLNPKYSVKFICDNYGYPFKSKKFSKYYYDLFHYGMNPYINDFANFELDTKFSTLLLNQSIPFPVSNLCCHFLKKELSCDYAISIGCDIAITGMRREEGGNRKHVPCVDIASKYKRFNPLAIISNDFINTFIDKFNVTLCDLYYPPYSFKRTGCKGCPFNPNIFNDLETMKNLLPVDYAQCVHLFGKVYDFYKEIGYLWRN